MTSNSFGLVLAGAAFREQVGEHYIELPYHNIEHADQVTLDALLLADYCEENGLRPNRLVLLLGSQYHDAGYHEELDTSRFSSKERYSMHLARQDLPAMGVDDETVEEVASCIGSTERGVACQSLEAKILRRADLSNLAGPLGSMLLSSYNFFSECRQLSGLQSGWIDFVRGTRDSIQDYLSEDVSFGDFDRVRDRSKWLHNVERNLMIVDMIVAQPIEIASRALSDLVSKARETA